MFLDLVQGAAVLLALSLLYGISQRLGRRWRRTEPVVSGALFGGVCVIGMMLPVVLAPGVFFDARTVVLSMAGLFGGPVVALIAGAIAAAYRIGIGGPGTAVGITTIAIAIVLGLAYRYARRREWIRVTPAYLLLFGFVLHLATVPAFAQLPPAVAEQVLRELVPSYLSVFTLATAFLGLLLLDIEKRFIAEAALRKSETRLRAIISALPDRLFVFDGHGQYRELTSGDPADMRETGAAAKAPSPDDTLPPAPEADIRDATRAARASGVTQTVEYETGNDGTPSYFEARVQPLDDGSADRESAVVLARDITARKRAELDLRIAATAFEAQDGIVITDADAIALRVNRAFEEITGYASDEVVGRRPPVLNVERHDPEEPVRLWEEVHANGVWRGEVWTRRRDGELIPLWLRLTAVADDHGRVTHYVVTLADITRRKEMEQRIRHLAFYDALTNLPNRRLMLDRLQRAVVASGRHQSHGALLFIDIDNFKGLNDTFGHAVGDLLLLEVAKRLVRTVRASDTVARLGGDEFVAMLDGLHADPVEAAREAELIGEQIRLALCAPYDLNGRHYQTTCSVGATLFRGGRPGAEELMKQSDLAMYAAKDKGRNAVLFFDPRMQASVDDRAALEQEMWTGLDERQFALHYQPQVDQAGRMVGVEALLRWSHPERGMISPGAFIPVAEQTGLILQLGRFVLKCACRQLAVWATTPGMEDIVIAINVSARQLLRPDFVGEILGAIEETGADPRKLQLEITESMLLDDVEQTITKMDELGARGVHFSLDDFGTGYSSLAYLQRLPLDQLKIDQSFVSDLLTDTNAAAIAQAIVLLAQTLDMRVTAEGVETREQRDALAALGCSFFQGYLFGHPVPAEQLAAAQTLP